MSGATLKSFEISQDNDQYDSGDLNPFGKDAKEGRKCLSSFNYSSTQLLLVETQTPLLISHAKERRVFQSAQKQQKQTGLVEIIRRRNILIFKT